MTNENAIKAQHTAIEELKKLTQDNTNTMGLHYHQERLPENTNVFLERSSWRRQHMYKGWMLEPIVEVVGERAAITRSNYGYRVLNTPDLGIVDVDFDVPCPRLVFADSVDPEKEEALANLREWVSEHPGQSWNVYRTAGGLRLIRTDAPQPLDESYNAVCDAIDGSDDLYRQLCLAQQAFRARVSPKPGRIGVEYPGWNPYDVGGNGWTESDPDGTEVPLAIKRYEIVAAQYKVCWLMEVVGSRDVHPDLKRVLTLHDEYCGTFSTLPLEPLHYAEQHQWSVTDLLAFNQEYRPRGMAPDKIWAVLDSTTRWALRNLDCSDERQRAIEKGERLERLAKKWA